MSRIKILLDTYNETIRDGFKHWGGHCLHNTDKDIPYGISYNEINHTGGNTFSVLESLEGNGDEIDMTSGYFYISDLYTEEVYNNVFLEILELTTYIFVNKSLCSGSSEKDFELALETLDKLKNKYGEKNVKFKALIDMDPRVEISYITTKIIIPC